MYSKIVLTLILTISICSIVAVTEDNSINDKNNSNLTHSEEIYSESGTNSKQQKKIHARKGVSESDVNSTINDSNKSPDVLPISENINIVENSSKTIVENVIKEVETSKQSPVTIPSTITKSLLLDKTASINSTSNSTEVKPIEKVKVPITSKPTTTTTTTTTPKPIPKKPSITYSADDNISILEMEKNVKYNLKENIVEEPIAELSKEQESEDNSSNEHKNFVMYIALVFSLPTMMVVITVGYKRFRHYMELREYRRVDCK